MTAAGSAKNYRLSLSEVATYTTTAPTGGSTWIHMPVEGQPLPNLEQGVDEPVIGNTSGASVAGYPTVKKSDISWTMPIYTGSTSFDGASGDTDPTSCFFQKGLESYFGMAASASFTGTTVASGTGAGRTAAMKVASASNLAVGMMVMVNGEGRFITAISGTDITLNCDLSTTPSLGDVVAGCFNFKPTLGEYAKYLYLNAERDGHKWLLGPGKMTELSVTNLAAGGGLRYGGKYEGTTWTSGVSISSFTPNEFSGQPVVAAGGQTMIDTVTSICITDGTLNFGSNHEWRSCSNGTEGRDGTEIVHVENAGATWTEYYNATRFTQFTAQTAVPVALVFAVGSTTAAKRRGAIGVFYPNATLKVSEATQGNLVAMSVTLKANLPTSAQITAGLTSPVYFSVAGGN